MSSELKLRYGCNPHQSPARVFVSSGKLPIEVLNGEPGYINLLDALNSWQLVRELRQALNRPAAASFKHVSPAGAAVSVPMCDTLKKIYFVDGMELSGLAVAYARARGADRMSSFGDWIALSDVCDVSVAKLIKREVSDGIIAPGYEPAALEILKQKKGGRYPVIAVDASYAPSGPERRDVFGVTFEQKRNDYMAGPDMLRNIVTARREIPESAVRDLIVAQIALKYTQSNSVILARDGQVIGVGAGQQSRIHCVRLAAAKADRWFLRQHPAVVGLKFKAGITRPERDNAIDQFIEGGLTPSEEKRWLQYFETPAQKLSAEERLEWLHRMAGVSLASDAFFPFRDSIDRAALSGVSFIVQPGGSLRDDDVIEACNEYDMVMAFTGVRLFHH